MRMTLNIILITAAISVLVICFYLLSDKNEMTEKSRETLKYLAIIAPVVTILAMMAQWYSAWKQQLDSRKRLDIQAVDRLWTDLLKYLHENMQDVQPLYREMFPREAQHLDQPITTASVEPTPITTASTEAVPVPAVLDNTTGSVEPVPAVLGNTAGKFHHKEILVAHRVAQSTEDFLGYDFGYKDNETWLRIIKGWWKSPRLRLLWKSISYAYDEHTIKTIELLIQKNQ